MGGFLEISYVDLSLLKSVFNVPSGVGKELFYGTPKSHEKAAEAQTHSQKGCLRTTGQNRAHHLCKVPHIDLLLENLRKA